MSLYSFAAVNSGPVASVVPTSISKHSSVKYEIATVRGEGGALGTDNIVMSASGANILQQVRVCENCSCVNFVAK